MMVVVDKVILECPHCKAQFKLGHYQPDRRFRCRKCQAVIIVPDKEGNASKSSSSLWQSTLTPELNEKLVKIFSLRKLAIIAGVVFFLVIGGVAMMIYQYLHQPVWEEPIADEELPITPENWSIMSARVPFPLAEGLSWSYSVTGGKSLERKIVGSSRGPQGQPQFDLSWVENGMATIWTLRIEKNGIYALSERRGAERFYFEPPLMVIPYPLYFDSKWSYEGQVQQDQGGAESWKLNYVASHDTTTTPTGQVTSVRVQCTGTRRSKPADDTSWYSLGMGLVRFQSVRPPGLFTAELKQKPPATE